MIYQQVQRIHVKYIIDPQITKTSKLLTQSCMLISFLYFCFRYDMDRFGVVFRASPVSHKNLIQIRISKRYLQRI